MQNRATLPFVRIVNLAQNKPLTRRVVYPEIPVLPEDMMSLNAEAGALRLRNRDGLEIRTQRLHIFRQIIPECRGDSPRAKTAHPKNHHRPYTNNGVEPLKRRRKEFLSDITAHPKV